jgi:hypothetical protein
MAANCELESVCIFGIVFTIITYCEPLLFVIISTPASASALCGEKGVNLDGLLVIALISGGSDFQFLARLCADCT